MGTSNTIDQQAALNQAFQTYIAEQTKTLTAMTDAAQETINNNITTYYKTGNWDDAKPLASGTYQDLATASEWSLTNVANMITAVRNAIFGVASPPAGSTVPPQPTDLSANVAKMSDLTLLITSAAFNAIQGILVTFTSGTQTGIRQEYSTKELAPGLTLFLSVIQNQFQRSDFLTNNTIIQTGYVYNTMFSVKQAGDIATFNEVQSLLNEQNTTEGLISKFNTALGSLDVTADDYDAKYTFYNAHLEQLNSQLASLQSGIASLAK